MKRSILVFVFLFSLSFSLFAQSNTITTEEADLLYGSPEKSINISVTVLEYFIENHEYIMLKIRDGMVNIFGKDREPIIQEFQTDDEDIYFVFESKDLKELLQIEDSKISHLELRTSGSALQNDGKIVQDANNVTTENEIITVTNGKITLLPPFWCPPFCFED